ncbi:MAG: alkaline phosphatase [Lysobacterales bacterium CG02_land_8_20_14_3_00_62_12]|nr:MAG: alkaline phosphatase [Xanthomonadales bacterium CG02_land_8_20_14_3_00_62_12]
MKQPLEQRANQLLRTLTATRPALSRRDVLQAALALSASAVAQALLPARGFAADAAMPRFTAYPFALGVASGYPQADRVTLWTRLAPEPLRAHGGMLPEMVDVNWELADDENFRQIVQTGRVRAVPELAHSARITVKNLRPDRWYYYRFASGDAVSRIGRTRTAPAADSLPDHFRMAIGSCQHYEQAWFSAHRHALAEDLDLMLFLGDYIYESSWGDNLVRRQVGGEAVTLANYRVRHAQYKTDADLQNSHAAMPWAYTWDDHEVDNDYAGATSEHLDPAFLLRRAAAYQAFFEHQPMPFTMRPTGADMLVYTTLDIGRLARIYLLDDRQYRSPEPCPTDYKGGGSTDVAPDQCPTVNDPAQTMLGATQEAWLDRALAASSAQWNLIAQQTLFSRFDGAPGPARLVWTEGWDAYPAARHRLLASLQNHHSANPLILGGDIHATVVANVHAEAEDLNSAVVAAEFCGTSIGSQGWPPEKFNARLPENPHVIYGDTSKRGYLRFDFNQQRCAADVRLLDNEKKVDSAIRTAASFIVENGKPGVRKA